MLNLATTATASQTNLPLPAPASPDGSIEGRVTRVVYEANTGTMRIFQLEDDDRRSHTIRQFAKGGALAPLAAKDQVRVLGKFVDNPRFGRQFDATDIVRRTATTAQGVAKVISGKAFKGIGPRLAGKLVDRLGQDLPDILNRGDPGELITDIIGAKKAKVLVDAWLQDQAVHMTDATLAELGVGPETRKKIRREIPDIETVIYTDPYRLARDVDGIGFRTADQLAMRAGIFEPASAQRLSVGVLHALEMAAQEGHTGLSREQLIDKACEALTFTDRRRIAEIIQNDIDRQDLVTSPNNLVQNRWVAHRESRLARYLYGLAKAAPPPDPALALTRHIDKIAARYSLNEAQTRAVSSALANLVSIITGGPGTGKTHTIKAICDLVRKAAQQAGRTAPRILLLAPTGKAADKMSDATGMDASTIHSALGTDPEAGGFLHDESEPLEADVIVADEFSMVDTRLADAFIRAIRPGHTRLIIVGDINQIPSVDAGRVLQDIIESGIFPVTRFTEIRRTGAGSAIALGAARINDGLLPDFGLPGKSDLVFIEEQEPDAIAGRIERMLTETLPAFTRLPPEAIQVLTPGKNSAVGTNALNARLQDAINPGETLRYGHNGAPVHIANGRPARLGDRVICTRNRRDLDVPVFNGDVGTIIGLEEEGDTRLLVVDCGKKVLRLDGDYWGNIAHAWALTIHKFQGSECEVIVIPMTTSHYTLLKRNLFYTGVTRARRLCIIIGTKRAIRIALETTDGTTRQTGLLARLRNLIAMEEF